jgi:DNA-binding transcriptional MerR regulator
MAKSERLARPVSITGRSTRSIGEVITFLRDEFPELSVSKIRFLETQGLIDPQRSQSGYREFTDDDLRRIQYVLREQRDHFLPLKVIKAKLQAWEAGTKSGPAAESGPPADIYFAEPTEALNASELASACGLDPGVIGDLIDLGILLPRTSSRGTWIFDEVDRSVGHAAARLLDRGLDIRHLRSIKLGADREYDVLIQLAGPLLRHNNPESRQRATDILADTAHAASQLQEGVLKGRLRAELRP